MKFQFAVKFLFAILFAAVAALTLTGLRGCQTTASEAAELEAHHVETNRFNQFDNVETIYHITCGKSGKYQQAQEGSRLHGMRKRAEQLAT